MKFKRGDVFATLNPTWIGSAVNKVQAHYSPDKKSEYGHSGMIINPQGDTFEALWKYEINDFYDKYHGKKAVIARYDGMIPTLFEKAYTKLFDLYYDKRYPIWRLGYHLISPVFARDINIFRKPVCSELVAQMLFLCGLRHRNFMGTNVDMLVDEWRNFKGVNIIWEGTA